MKKNTFLKKQQPPEPIHLMTEVTSILGSICKNRVYSNLTPEQPFSGPGNISFIFSNKPIDIDKCDTSRICFIDIKLKPSTVNCIRMIVCSLSDYFAYFPFIPDKTNLIQHIFLPKT